MRSEYEMDPVGKEYGSARGTPWDRRSGIYGRQSTSSQARVSIPRWLDTFRRDPESHITPEAAFNRPPGLRRSVEDGSELASNADDESHHDDRYFDLHAANVGTANSMLARELKGRHLQMIAMGGSIG